MFDPTTARFLSKDPLGEAGGSPNPYLYCANDPVNQTDPSGNKLVTNIGNARCGASVPDQLAGGEKKTGVPLWEYLQAFATENPEWTAPNRGPLRLKPFGRESAFDLYYGAFDLFAGLPADVWGQLERHKGGAGGEGSEGWLARWIVASLSDDVVVEGDGTGGNVWFRTWDDFQAMQQGYKDLYARRKGEVADSSGRSLLGQVARATLSEAADWAGGKLKEGGEFVIKNAERVVLIGLTKLAEAAGVKPDDLFKALDEFGFSGDLLGNLLTKGVTIFKNVAKGVQYGLEDFCGEDVLTTKGCKDVLSRLLDAVGTWVGVDGFADLVKVVGKWVSGAAGATLKDAAGPVAKVFGLTWDRVLGLLLRAINTAAGGKDVSQAVLTVTGVLEKMGPWLGVAEDGQPAKSGLGGFVAEVIDKIDSFKQGLDAADLADLDLPALFWNAFQKALLEKLPEKLAEFAVAWVAKLTPTPGAVVGWVKTAWGFYKAIQSRIAQLKAILESLRKIVTQVVKVSDGDAGALKAVGKEVSSVIQNNIPVAFSVLAAALELGQIEQLPKNAFKAVNEKVDDTVVKFLTAIAKPVVGRLAGLFKGRGLDGLTLLTKPVALKKDPTRMGVLVKKGGAIRLYLSGSDFTDAGDAAAPLAADGKKLAESPGGQPLSGPAAKTLLEVQTAAEKKIADSDVTPCVTGSGVAGQTAAQPACCGESTGNESRVYFSNFKQLGFNDSRVETARQTYNRGRKNGGEQGGDTELKRWLVEVRNFSKDEADDAINLLKRCPFDQPVSNNPWVKKTPEEVATAIRQLPLYYKDLKVPASCHTEDPYPDSATCPMKSLALALNKMREGHGNEMRSDLSGIVLLPAQRSARNVTPHPDEWAFDHRVPYNGSNTTFANLAIISRDENRRKYFH